MEIGESIAGLRLSKKEEAEHWTSHDENDERHCLPHRTKN